MGDTTASVVWIVGTFFRPSVRPTSRAISCRPGQGPRDARSIEARNARARAIVHPTMATAPRIHARTRRNPPFCVNPAPPAAPRGPADRTALNVTASAETGAGAAGFSTGTAISGGTRSAASSVRQSA